MMTLLLSTNSFLSASLEYWLLWALTFALASLFYWFGYGKSNKELLAKQAKDLQKLKPELGVLKNQQEHLTAEKVQLKNNLEDLLKKHNSLKGYHENVQAKYQAATKQFESANEERQSMLDSYESLEKNLETTEKNYNDALAKIDQLELELEKMEETSDSPISSSTFKEIKRLETLLDKKEATITKLEHSLSAASIGRLELVSNNEVDATQAEAHKQLIAEKDKLQESYTAIKTDYNQLRNTHTKLTNKYQALEADNQKINQKVKSLELSLHSAKNNLSGESTNIIALKESNESLNEHQQQLKTKIEALEAQNKEKSNEVKKMQLQYHTVELQQKELTNIKYQLQNSLTKLNKEFTDLKAVNENLKGRYELLLEQYQQALSNNKELQNTILKLEKTHSEKKGSLGQIEQILQTLRTENAKLKEENINLTITKKQVDQQLTASAKEIQTLLPKVKSVKTDNHTELKQLKLKLQQQNEELLKAQEKLNAHLELRSTNLALDTNNKSLNTAYTNIQKKYDSFHKEYLNLKSQFQLLRDKYEHLENTSANEQQAKNRLNKTNANLMAQLKQVQTNQKKLAEEKRSYEIRLKELEKYLSTPKKKSTRQSKTTQVIKNRNAVPTKPDDLKIIEGIGPKIEVLLNKKGITTWKQLSGSGIGELKRLLAAAGDQYLSHDPSTWPEQAKLAAMNKWKALEELQEELIGGRRR